MNFLSICLLSRREADLFIDLAQRFFGEPRRAFRARAVDAFQISLVAEQAGGFLPDGAQQLDDRLAYRGFECAVALPLEIGFGFLEGFARGGAVDG